jgi:tetratricopeptide (TPR) repeat protein
MWRFSSIALYIILLFLFSTTTILAQGNNEVVQVVVSGDAKVIMPFLLDTQEFLSNYDISLDIIITDVRYNGEASELIPNAHLYIEADGNYPAKGWKRARVWLNKTAYRSPSSVLFVLNHTLSFDVNEVLPNIADILASIIFYAIGDCDNALQVFETVESQFGDVLSWRDEYGGIHESNAGVHDYISLYWGNCAVVNEDYNTAIKYYSSSDIHSYAYEPPFYVTNLAWVYVTIGDNEAAFNEEMWEPYIYQSAWGTLALSRRAQLYALAFDYASAIEDIDFAIELAEANEVSDEQLAELYTLRGEIIFLIYEWDRVLENFNTALELAPDYAPAYFQRGVLYYTMTERESALADFQHYLELAPDGEHAAAAQRYIDSIQLELESLDG